MFYYLNLLKTASKFYKLAEIMHPPQQKYIFVANFQKKLNSLISEIEQNVKHFNSEVGQDYLRDLLGVSFNEINFISNILLRNFKDIWQFQYLLEALDKRESYLSILDSIIDRLKEFKEDLEKYLNRIKKELENYHEYLDYYLNNNREDIFETYHGIEKNDYKFILEIPSIIEMAILETKIAISKLEAWEKKDRNFDKPPKHEPIEILYHTTVNADKLLSQGFSENWEQGEGLGGSMSTKTKENGVSFTSNLYVAKEILRTLKELIAIAHGQIKKRHILEWMRGEPYYDEVIKTTRSIYGWDLEDDRPIAVAELYRIYLNYSSSHIINPFSKLIRYDPFYMNLNSLMDNLKNKSEKDVGIIAAEIDMTYPAIDYFGAMDEYRVPVKAINKIVNIIR